MEKEGEGDGLLQAGTGGGGDSRIAAVYTGRHGCGGCWVVGEREMEIMGALGAI